MLIRFEVSNFRSIREPAELSMVAVDRDRPEARPITNLGESLLPVAAIYGPNASGKTNVIAAMNWLFDAVRDSLALWDDEIPLEPFAGLQDEPSEFTVEAVISGVRFEYMVELDHKAVRYEGLFHYPEKKRRRIFEREGEDLKLQRGLGNLSGTRELLTERTLALVVARRFNEPLVSDFANYLRIARTLGLRTPGPLRMPLVGGVTYRQTRDYFDIRVEQESTLRLDKPTLEDRSQALAMLQLADLGIEDVTFEATEVRNRVQRTLRMMHRIGDELIPFDIQAESAGTRTWYELIGPVLQALKSGSLLLFDELDASLHPTLSAQLIRLFHDPSTNPQGAQLIFTSHDTSLLNHLNRDEIWLTEKASTGTTHLGALAEFAGERVRRSQNLENAYLHGRFGALPDVDRTGILRALGLIG